MRRASFVIVSLLVACQQQGAPSESVTVTSVAQVNGADVSADWVSELGTRHQLTAQQALREAIRFELLAQEAHTLGYGRGVDPKKIQRRAAVQRLLQEDIEVVKAEESKVLAQLQEQRKAHTVADGFFEADAIEAKLRAAETDRQRFGRLAKLLQQLEKGEVKRHSTAIDKMAQTPFDFGPTE